VNVQDIIDGKCDSLAEWDQPLHTMFGILLQTEMGTFIDDIEYTVKISRKTSLPIVVAKLSKVKEGVLKFATWFQVDTEHGSGYYEGVAVYRGRTVLIDINPSSKEGTIYELVIDPTSIGLPAGSRIDRDPICAQQAPQND